MYKRQNTPYTLSTPGLYIQRTFQSLLRMIPIDHWRTARPILSLHLYAHSIIIAPQLIIPYHSMHHTGLSHASIRLTPFVTHLQRRNP